MAQVDEAVKSLQHFCRRSQQFKSQRSRSSQAWAGAPSAAREQSQIRASLEAVLLSAPKAMLSACLECLGYGSGELFDAAKEALGIFLAPGKTLPWRNGSVAVADPGSGAALVRQAVSRNAKLVSWLTSALQSTRGEVTSLSFPL